MAHLKKTISWPKSLSFLGNFCKGVKIYHFSCEIIFGSTTTRWVTNKFRLTRFTAFFIFKIFSFQFTKTVQSIHRIVRQMQTQIGTFFQNN